MLCKEDGGLRLSSVYLYEKIKEKYKILKKGNLSGTDGYLRPFLYLEKKIVQKKHVYLIQGEHIADLVQRASDTEETFWIIRRKAGTERLQISDELPDTLVYMEIVLEGMEEIYGFMNDLQEIFDAADEWERKIHNLMVEHAGMESLLKVTSEFLQNSLAVKGLDFASSSEVGGEDLSSKMYTEHWDHTSGCRFISRNLLVDEKVTHKLILTETQTETESETMSAEESEAAAKAEEEAKEAAMAAAKAKADEMLSKIKDEASFEKVYDKYASDTTVDSLNTGKKKSSISPTDVANWLFDADRQAGDTTVIEDTANNAYYVVYFKDRYLDHIKTVDVRQILISADTSSSDAAETDETETTAAGETETAETESAEAQEQAKEDAKAAAKIKAEQILDDWKNGDATEDSFAELAKTYSDDTGSNTNGGLYEAVKEGQMVTNFNDWCFDASRKAGDTGIVESDYGYHIIYFIGDDAEEWHVNIKDTITSNKLNDYMSNLTADLEVKDSRHHVAYLHETEAATETASETDTAAATESAAASETTTASETAVSETETVETAAK